MTKRKYPSELNTRLLRVNVDTYLVVKGLSRQLNITMAEALDQLITGQALKAPISPAQIRMPVTMAESMPITTVYRSTPVTAITINGSKAAAFKIKAKGVRHD